MMFVLKDFASYKVNDSKDVEIQQVNELSDSKTSFQGWSKYTYKSVFFIYDDNDHDPQ